MKTTDDILDQLHRLKTQTEMAIQMVQDGLLKDDPTLPHYEGHFIIGDFSVFDLKEIQQKRYEQP